MGQRERGGKEDFGLTPWPHWQVYNPQLIKASIELGVLRDALPSPLNLCEGCRWSVPGTALPLRSHPGRSGGRDSSLSNSHWCLDTTFRCVVSFWWHPSTQAFSWQFPTFPPHFGEAT